MLKRIAIDQGIHAARLLLPRCYFDERQTRDLIAALSSYRREWDEDRKVFSVKPAHEWSSDGAASFRYLALGLREPRDGWADCPASTTATSSPRIA